MTNELKEMITKLGGDISSLPDNLETTLYKALCNTLGVDYSDCGNNLISSYQKEIINECTGGGSVNVTDDGNGNVKIIGVPVIVE